MCVLTRERILAEIDDGRIRIEPFSVEQVGPASIDLHLGDEVRLLAEDGSGPIDVGAAEGDQRATRLVRLDGGFILDPGQTVHGITRERVGLPPDVCAWIDGRSSIARLGLTVHVTSGFVHPGASNHQVLEMRNLSRVPLRLRPGIRICQVILERTEGQAVYTGRFADQHSP
jgi:dCTP deaminase